MDASRLLVLAACAIVSYFVCGIPFGLLIASRMSGVDVRKTGSGNIGMTNVARSAGGKAAALTFACDVGKGTVCVVLARLVLSAAGVAQAESLQVGQANDWMCAVVYLSCVLGHIFSPYLHFHGGKGISVGLGSSLGLCWPVGLGAFAVFLVLAIPTRLVSLGSVAAALSLPVIAWLMGMTPAALVPVCLVSVVVIWSHRENVGRLLRGEERRFALGHDKGPK